MSDAAEQNLYYWSQVGWGAGLISRDIRRLKSSDLTKLDETSAGVPNFSRDAVDAPNLLDEERKLVFVKNKVFDAENLTKVLYTLPGPYDVFYGSAENAYALDAAQGRMATKTTSTATTSQVGHSAPTQTKPSSTRAATGHSAYRAPRSKNRF